MNLVDGFAFSDKKSLAEVNSVTNPYALATKEDVKDQFMLGDYLLVAPMFAGDKKRKVVLPQGKWYDFYSGEYAGAGQIIEIEPGLEKIPLYVKDGAIIPMIPAVLHTPKPGEVLPLELRHYGESNGNLSLYDDDGETFNYEKGNFMTYSFSATKSYDGKWIKKEDIHNKNKMPQQYDRFTWNFMTSDKK